MTTVQITLPDQLAQEAERAGLLSSESLQEMLRKQLKSKAVGDLLLAVNRIHSIETQEDFSPRAMAEEVWSMRAERQMSQGRA